MDVIDHNLQRIRSAMLRRMNRNAAHDGLQNVAPRPLPKPVLQRRLPQANASTVALPTRPRGFTRRAWERILSIFGFK